MPRNRRSSAALLATLLTIGLLAAPASAAPAAPEAPAAEPSSALYGGQIQLQLVASGLYSPVGVVNAGDGTNRLFVLERGGRVAIFANHQFQGNFMDLGSLVGDGFRSGGEEGLLGLAFHPSFETNRKVFAYYTNGAGNISIAEFTTDNAGTAAQPGTWDRLLEIGHPGQSNHNGGQLMFGPDGYLYAFVGDGGGGGDPGENAQDLNERLGKVLRIAPNLAGSYTIPAGNPYPGAGDGHDEIWASGVRNPWRASFDRGTGDLWIADVGQDNWEEINHAIGNPAGLNYGWDNCEGLHPYEGSCAGFTPPVAEYATGSNCSITGGYVYRGSVYLDFVGQYIVGDFCSGNVWTLDPANPSAGLLFHRDSGVNISSFGEAENGEIYMTHLGGALYKVVAPTFNDVIGSPHIDDITWLHYAGITTGCGGGSFCPTPSVSRAEMASFLARALALPAASTDYFWDDAGNIHEGNINAVAQAGITLGCGGGAYCPNSPVTRDEMASFLARAMSLPAAPTDYFWDDAGNIHEGNINAVAFAGITLGCGGGQYCPGSPTTREQMASFIRRALT